VSKIVSHRGANKFAPENTFAAANLALEQGADYIELDVRESADGVLYVIYDEALDRTTNAKSPVGHIYQAKSTRSMQAAGLMTNSRVPTSAARCLSRASARWRRCLYRTEILRPGQVVALVRDLGMVRDTFYFSFSEEMRRDLQIIAPELIKIMTLNIAKSPSLVGAAHHALIIEITPEQMRRPAIIEASRKAGLDIMVYYGGDDIAVHREIASAGVDYINLDRPDLFDAARGDMNGVAA
jgi:glycerophosphoryl diester phosphodiesterase